MSVLNVGGSFGGGGSLNGVIMNGSGFTNTQGVNYSGSVWGSTIPISAGFRKVDGVVLWSGPVVKADVKSVTTPPAPGITGGTAVTYTSWTLRRSFAVGLGKRLNPSDPPPQIRRIWADGTLVYANGVGIPLNYRGLQGDYLPTGRWVNGVWIPIPGTDGLPSSEMASGLALHGDTVPLNPLLSSLTFRFHDGNETQMPDQALVSDLGSLATAFRGLMYLVIDGLIVGKGFEQTSNYGDLQDMGTIPGFPQVSVELVDGTLVTVAGHNFIMLDSATPFQFPDAVILADFESRELASVAPTLTGGFLNLYDMDTSTQTACLAITGNGTDAIGPTAGFAVWDHINSIFYTERAGDHCICALDKTGALTSTALTIGPNLVPRNVDSTTITDAKPCVEFPRPNYGDVAYVISANLLEPVVLAGNGWFAAFSPSPGGVIPATLKPRQFALAGGSIKSVKAFPLGQIAAKETHLSYQDAAFVIAYQSVPAAVDLVYVGLTVEGGVNVSVIRGQHTIYTATDPAATLHAMLDDQNNVVIQEFKLGSPTLFTKIAVDINASPDFTLAPGWRGHFPKVGATVLNAVPSGETGVWEANVCRESDVSAGTFAPNSDQIVNLHSGVVDATITGFAAFGSTTSVWDSKTQTRYFHGTVTGTGGHFSGHGLNFAQVYSGIDGTLSSVGTYLREIAHLAGFLDADLTIDTSLTDEVPGVLILHPYDLTTLFNDIGSIYEFTYFNSAGKLKFQRASNSPVKASGGWTISGAGAPTITIQDGDTATIGSFVYRFKITPVAPFDVKISADDSTTVLNAREKTAANFLAALKADLTVASLDSQNPALNPAFFAGTVKHTQVVASSTTSSTTALGFLSISLTAIVGGVAGNAIATTSTGAHAAFDHLTLTSGAEPPTPSVTITRADMAFVSEQHITQFDAIVTTIAPKGQSQQAAAIDYYALEQDYLLSQQLFIPDSQNGALGLTGATTVDYALPFIMSTSEAYARVAKTAIRQADNVVVQQFRLPQKYLLTEPSDVIAVTIPPFSYTLRVDEATFNGDLSTSFLATNYSFRSDVVVSDSDSTGLLPQTIASGSDGLPFVLDAPLRDPLFGSIAGNIDLFDGVRAYNFNFGLASFSVGKVTPGVAFSSSQLFATSRDAKWGTVVGSLPVAVEPLYRTVEDTITISCKTIDPFSDVVSGTYLDMVQGKNCIAVGSPGNWEYIFFRDVVAVNPKVITLTGLVRGQRGTDFAIAGHGPGDVVVLLASVAPGFDPNALVPQSLVASEAGNVYRYQVVGQPSSRLSVSNDVTVRGYVLYPFSPCRLKAALVAGNDLNLTWVRRDRLGTKFVTVAQPMSETTELYDLEIMSGAAVVRTVNGLTTPAYTYTSAQQTTDGFAPPMTSLKFRVYQKGELGRGFPRLETVNVN